ncbi:MAG: hypothetical protein ACREUU_01620, partial [Gammaproteobacteria bacterium]
FCAVICRQVSLAQVTPGTVLEIDLENRVNYNVDVFDVSRFATDPNVTTPTIRNFRTGLQIGDIVAVNGRPAKGSLVVNFQFINLRTAPNPRQAIADTVANNTVHQTFQILQPDGRRIGSIMVSGIGGGDAPPGAPSAVLQGDNVIVGGTGAFLGVRGQSGAGRQLIAIRDASVTEDPANRRRHGGGAGRIVLHLIPLARPEVVITPNGPAVFHGADFSLVTAAKPARAGEVLILTATNLGPTRPGVDPGKPFPLNPLPEVNSPVDVVVNGQAGEVINKIGWPGLENVYRVDFRVPDGTGAGIATLQLTAAWIAGSEVKIAVQ